MRWTGRTSSQRQARTIWVAPDLDQISRKHDLLSQYSNPDYLLGGSTDQELQKMAWRLQFGKAESLPELPGHLPSSKEPIREIDDEPHIAELEGEPYIAELEGVPVNTFQFCPASRPKNLISFTE